MQHWYIQGLANRVQDTGSRWAIRNVCVTVNIFPPNLGLDSSYTQDGTVHWHRKVDFTTMANNQAAQDTNVIYETTIEALFNRSLCWLKARKGASASP